MRQRRAPMTEPNLIRPLIDTSLLVTPGRRYLLRSDPAMEVLGHWNFDSDLAAPRLGHRPGSKGSVYFTDTQQVWKVSPDGSVSVAVPHVHTPTVRKRLRGSDRFVSGGANDRGLHCE